ncbi:hypothetical protein [Alicyclobacillus tolerans]|nr:hypothetical protein [Alicyclobacillus montanus]
MSTQETEQAERAKARAILKRFYDYPGTTVYVQLQIPDQDLTFWIDILNWTLDGLCKKDPRYPSPHLEKWVEDILETRDSFQSYWERHGYDGRFPRWTILYTDAFWILDMLAAYVVYHPPNHQSKHHLQRVQYYQRKLEPYHERYFFDELKKHSMEGMITTESDRMDARTHTTESMGRFRRKRMDASHS